MFGRVPQHGVDPPVGLRIVPGEHPVVGPDQHVLAFRQPGEVGQAVVEGIQVASGPLREVQSGSDPVERSALVGQF